MDEEQFALAEAVCVRLCHDLAGPVQALSGLAELLAESAPGARAGAAAEAELHAMLAEAVVAVADALRLRRRAWGGGVEADGPLGREALAELAAGIGGRKVVLDLARLPPGFALPAALAPVLLNALMVATAALPRGGRVRLEPAGGGGVRIRPEGAGAAWPALLAGLAAGVAPRAQPEARDIAVLFLVGLARRRGVALVLEQPAPAGAETTRATRASAGTPADAPALLLRPRG